MSRTLTFLARLVPGAVMGFLAHYLFGLGNAGALLFGFGIGYFMTGLRRIDQRPSPPETPRVDSTP